MEEQLGHPTLKDILAHLNSAQKEVWTARNKLELANPLGKDLAMYATLGKLIEQLTAITREATKLRLT